MHVDPFRLAIALVPLAAYVLLLGLVNLRRRPFLTSRRQRSGGARRRAFRTGVRRAAGIVSARGGHARSSAITSGCFCWCSIGCGCCWWCCRAAAAGGLQHQHRRIASGAGRSGGAARSGFALGGQQLSLPNLGVQLHLESFDLMRNVSLVSSGSRQNIDGWRELARELAAALQPVRVKPNPRGVGFLLVSLLLMAGSLTQPRESSEGAGARGERSVRVLSASRASSSLARTRSRRRTRNTTRNAWWPLSSFSP